MKKVTIADAEKVFAQSKTETLILDPRTDVSYIVQYFLREAKGRFDLALAFSQKSECFFQQLERIRSLVTMGNVDEAQTLIPILKPTSRDEHAEVAIECMRIHMFRNEPQQALNIADTITPVSNLISKLTVLQMRGHALINLKRHEEAIVELVQAVTLADLFPFASSGFSSRTFLVRAYSELGKENEAKTTLEHFFKVLLQQDIDCQWLDHFVQWIRAETRYLRAFGSKDEVVRNLFEAKHISAWLEDGWTVENCLRDIKELQISDKNYLSNAVLQFSGWSYVPRHHLILINESKRAVSLQTKKLWVKIIENLALGPMPIDQFFQKVWNLPYRPGYHENTIHQAIFKMRKSLVKSMIQQQDSTLQLL